MWMNMSLATFRCLYRVSWSLKALRSAADSLAMTERSSAAVLHALTALIRSLQGPLHQHRLYTNEICLAQVSLKTLHDMSSAMLPIRTLILLIASVHLQS